MTRAAALRAIAALAVPGERGVGDTIERLLTSVGLHQVVQLAAQVLGGDCGCAARRDELNAQYPYQW